MVEFFSCRSLPQNVKSRITNFLKGSKMSSKTQKLKLPKWSGEGQNNSIYVLRRCRKSGGTLRTFSDLPPSFLATLVFGFLGTFLENPIPSSDFSWNAADCINFAATGNADGDDLSLNLCSEALSEVRRDVTDLFWPSYNNFSLSRFSSFRAHFCSFSSSRAT